MDTSLNSRQAIIFGDQLRKQQLLDSLKEFFVVFIALVIISTIKVKLKFLSNSKQTNLKTKLIDREKNKRKNNFSTASKFNFFETTLCEETKRASNERQSDIYINLRFKHFKYVLLTLLFPYKSSISSRLLVNPIFPDISEGNSII